jgi:catechol 2,3-dioxygenase-like lactoylglutathione lyase family enzyme
MPVGNGRVVHINVNCTDLERSLAFYRDELGLRAVGRTAPEAPQDGKAFGLAAAQWDAWMMAGSDGFKAPVIDLLRWIVPAPGARDEQTTVGFRQIRVGGSGGSDRTVRDPDGTPVLVTGGPAGLSGVAIGCSDLSRSEEFYDDVVGISDFIDLVPGSGVAPPAANTVGIWRMALGTDDIDRDVAELQRAGVVCVSDPVELSMGPGIGMLRFVLFPDPDGTMLELIQTPTT